MATTGDTHGGPALAAAAQQLVGCKFRLHGREPATGLDCIGVLAAALTAIAVRVSFPTGYCIRTGRFAALPTLAASHGFVRASGATLPGDVLFTRPGPSQLHLVIAALVPGQFVEAHAGLRRVVMTTGPLADPVLQKWRLRAEI